jgi:hypothetical protein
MITYEVKSIEDLSDRYLCELHELFSFLPYLWLLKQAVMAELERRNLVQ